MATSRFPEFQEKKQMEQEIQLATAKRNEQLQHSTRLQKKEKVVDVIRPIYDEVLNLFREFAHSYGLRSQVTAECNDLGCWWAVDGSTISLYVKADVIFQINETGHLIITDLMFQVHPSDEDSLEHVLHDLLFARELHHLTGWDVKFQNDREMLPLDRADREIIKRTYPEIKFSRAIDESVKSIEFSNKKTGWMFWKRSPKHRKV